jgi:Chitinase class I
VTFSPDKLSELFPRIPSVAISANWPIIQAAIERRIYSSPLLEIAAIATIGVETAHTFEAIEERGSATYFVEHYWTNERVRRELGNQSPEEAVLYKGRGFVQISGRSNYDTYGRKLGIDLLANPVRALDASVAADILALFFLDHSIEKAADASNWKLVRERVNGGLNGWEDFIAIVETLTKAI